MYTRVYIHDSVTHQYWVDDLYITERMVECLRTSRLLHFPQSTIVLSHACM